MSDTHPPAPPKCQGAGCNRDVQYNFKTGKYWTMCPSCRAKKAKTAGQQSPARRIATDDCA